MDDPDETVRPRIVDTAEYVQNVIGKSGPNIGNDPSAARSVFQRLPRHMRRRAMSHNIRRLPRSIRPFAANLVKNTQHRKKPPSRFHRRRPSKMLKRTARVQRKGVWLETHIWHAKRFRMATLWGYRLPITCYQRGFRPTFRSSMNLCVAIDHSYLCCVQIICKNSPDGIISKLAVLCHVETSPTIANKGSLSGRIELGLYLFDGQRDGAFMGTSYFSWSKTKISEVRLQMWLHPSVSQRFLNSISKIEGLKFDHSEEFENESKVDGKNDGTSTNITETEEQAPRVLNLTNRLGRIRLIGPKAFSILSTILTLVSEEDIASYQRFVPYRESHEYWSKNAAKILPGNLRNGTIISLLVEDPRLFRARSVHGQTLATDPSTSLDPPLPYTELFWDMDFQAEQLGNRLTPSHLVKHQSNKLNPLKKTGFKVPILLVVHHASLSTTSLTSNSRNRVDVICPGGTTYDFWLSLQFGGARAVGLRDKFCLDFEAGTQSFPSDYPDCDAGMQYCSLETASLQTTYLRKPYNRRINYWSERLQFEFPFSFEWSKLVNQWNIKDNIKSAPSANTDRFYVLRDRQLLFTLNQWLTRNTKLSPHIQEILEKHSEALVQVQLENTGKGVPKRLALICIPSTEDIQKLKNDKRTVISEWVQMSVERDDEYPTGSEPSNTLAEPTEQKGLIPSIVSLSEESGSTYFQNPDKDLEFTKLVSLNALFPETVDRKRQLNIKKRQMRKETKKFKKRKLDESANGTQPKQHSEKTAELEEQSPTSAGDGDNLLSTYVESCSRPIVGRVVRGDYSFTRSRGFALGYISLCSIPSIIAVNNPKDRILLIRNTSSRYYRPARFSLCTDFGGL